MSNVIDQQIEEIEISIEQSKKLIDMMESMKKLTDNPDFKKVIIDGYFKDEASRLVLLKADDTMQDDKDQMQIMNQINAIGYVRKYFSTIYQLGHMAERSVEADKQTREELLAEGV